ncbi:MAG TPA: hypothetical protein VFQ53_11460 [Kofleriaceae bacterium]|nr:hypothetical protein [Kofleriaceae bacterium]
MKNRLVAALCATLLPAVALAQPVPTPTEPTDPNTPSPNPPAPAPTQNPAPTDPTQQVPPAPPPPPVEQQPVVIVNPPPRATVVSTTPAYETVEDPWNAPVFATGALVFAGSYGAAAIAAATASDENKDRGFDRLYVPIAGPWLALNDRGSCPIERQSCDNETTIKVLLVADGVFQAAGAITMVAGVLQPSHHRVYTRTTAIDKKVRVTPTVVGSHGSPGLGVFGHF